MYETEIIALLALGVSLGALAAFRISRREMKKLEIYDEEGIPRILDLSDPYIRIAYVAIGIAGPKNWNPYEVRRIASKIANVLREEDKYFYIRDNAEQIGKDDEDEVSLGLCPDCGSEIYETTRLCAGESLPIFKCRNKTCNWEGFDPPNRGADNE